MLCWIRVLSGSDRNRIEISSVITPLRSHQAMLPFFIALHCSILWQVSETLELWTSMKVMNLCPLPEPKLLSWNFKNMSQIDSFNNSETWNLCPPVPRVIQAHYLSKWKEDSLSSDTPSLQEVNKSEDLFPLYIWYTSSVISPLKQSPVKLLSVKSYFQFLI